MAPRMSVCCKSIGLWAYCLTATVFASESDTHSSPLITAEAQVSFIQDIEVAFGVGGRVQQVLVQEGDLIAVGQTVATLDARLAHAEAKALQYDADVARLQRENDVDLRYARATLEVHRSELERLRNANQRFANAVSQTELQRLELMVKQANLAIEQSERDLKAAALTESQKMAQADAARIRLEHFELTAPIAGMVVRVDAKRGTWIEAPTIAVRIVQLDRLRAEAFVDGNQFGSDLMGQTAEFIPQKNGRTSSSAEGLQESQQTDQPSTGQSVLGQSTISYTGKIVFVSPELHPVTGQVRVRCELENPNFSLRPGMHGDLRIAAPSAR